MIFASGWFFVVITIAFFVIQWLVMKSLPKYILNALAYYPLLGFFANLTASGSISMFTGVASFVGICNMVSSIGVSFWLIGYANFHDIELEWKKYCWFVKYPDFVQRKTKKNWFY